jgi:hypothetical protein
MIPEATFLGCLDVREINPLIISWLPIRGLHSRRHYITDIILNINNIKYNAEKQLSRGT